MLLCRIPLTYSENRVVNDLRISLSAVLFVITLPG